MNVKKTPMNVAKWLLLAVLMLPLAELTVFIAVTVAVGFLWALALVLATSLAGALILQHSGGNHIARMRVALDGGGLSAWQADSAGTLTLLAGVLLLIPGFITDAAGLLLLVAPLRRLLAAMLGRAKPAPPEGVLDLEPEQWHRVSDPTLANRQGEDPSH